jgi:ribonucleotide reductase alpha subunit
MYVIKRNGNKEPLDINKIKEIVNWSTEGANVNKLELESNLETVFYDGIKTSEINKNMIYSALKLANEENPEWLKVAGKLKYRDLREKVEKERGYKQGEDFWRHLAYQAYLDRYNLTLVEDYTREEVEEISVFLEPKRDLLYDYTGMVSLEKRYLIEGELPQEAYLAMAMMLCKNEGENRINYIKKIYDLVSLKKLSLASPILSNLRKPNTNLSSCFILSANDNLESIMDAVKDSAKISKNGGGVGVNVSKIRSKGAEIKGTKNASNGVLPFIKIFNDVGVAVDQGGKRAGAITVGLDIWHNDIFDFLEMQTETGDSRMKSYDVFPQVIIPNLFMEKVKKDEEWFTFDPQEALKRYEIDLSSTYGEEFEKNYQTLVENYEILEVKSKCKAKELFKKIVKTQIETGLPYIFFKDTANKYNPNKETGYIPQGNLCVAPETKILTDQGNLPIVELVGKKVNIWNGSEWSEVIPLKTGEHQKLIKIGFYEGKKRSRTYIECTPYHKFYIKSSQDDSEIKIEAKDLRLGDQIVTTRYENGVENNWEVLELLNENRLSDTYCVTEPKKGKVVFNGVLTGNCMESFSNVAPDEETHCCNLVSINLANLEKHEEHEVAEIAVRVLDNAIDITTNPTELTKKHNNSYRTIGIGFLGLADWLAKRNHNYETGGEQIQELMDRISYYCVKSSVNLAKERGSFNKFSDSEWAKGKILGRDIEWFKENSPEYRKWETLSEEIKTNGIRNSQLMAIAPNTSTGLLQGCTASILPPYELFGVDSNSKGTLPVAVSYLSEKRKYYQVNKEVNQKYLVELIGKYIQPYIDSGISMELVFDATNPEINSKFIADTIFKAWESECKTIYYIRFPEEKATETEINKTEEVVKTTPQHYTKKMKLSQSNLTPKRRVKTACIPCSN